LSKFVQADRMVGPRLREMSWLKWPVTSDQWPPTTDHRPPTTHWRSALHTHYSRLLGGHRAGFSDYLEKQVVSWWHISFKSRF
jgi:hypothetical protein